MTKEKMIEHLAEIKNSTMLLEGALKGKGLSDKTKLITRMCDDIAYRTGVEAEVEAELLKHEDLGGR